MKMHHRGRRARAEGKRRRAAASVAAAIGIGIGFAASVLVEGRAGAAAGEPAGAATPPADAAPAASGAPRAIPPAVAAAVEASDRTPADRALDEGRRPAETLAFFGVAPGMKVAEIGAGGGYTAELLARVVGPSGEVYGHNAPFVLQRFAEKPWSERLAKPVMKNVVRLDRPFDDPFPPEVRDLDAVLIILFYHDTYWQEVDRERMNAAVFRALKPGGVYGIVDHSARPGTGAADVQTLHRIEEKTLVEDVEKAGFELRRSADFLRNPDDARDWNASPIAAGEKRGESDRFVLAFVKPAP